MPLIASAYLIFAAGLLLGYARLGWAETVGSTALATVVLAAGLGRKDISRFALAVLFAGAVLMSAAGARPSSGSAFAAAQAGAESEHGVLHKTRERAGRAIDTIFGTDAPMAKALLIADRHQIPLEMNEAFVAAGLVHVLSISGLHVGIIAVAIALLLESARLSKRTSAVVTLVAVAVYVAILGAPPPALRAAAMVCAVTLGKLSQRPTSPWALLAIGASIPLLQPAVVLNLGYQLSVAGMAGLIASGSFVRRRLEPRLVGIRLRIAREISASLLATLITAPLVAWAFGRVSLVGPISNLAAGPIIVVLQPLLFLALLLAPFPSLARFVADAAHPLLRALDGCANFFAAIPGASVDVAPSALTVVFFIAAVCALVVAVVSRFPARPLIASAACCSIGIIAPFPVISSGMLELHMLDVGQGDAILLRTPPGRWILIDAGRAWKGGDAGRSVVVPYIRKRGGELTAFILSHPHMDHVGGASTVLRALHPTSYWDAAFAGGNAAYRKSLEVAAREKVGWHRVRARDSLVVDGVTLNFLAPDSVWTSRLTEANEASTVILVRYGMVRFLLTGDAEQHEEHWLENNANIPLSADVLKVGHHGSSTSSGDSFIERICPRVALISVGAVNSYGHPSRDVIAALRKVGARVLRTDQEGTIVVRSDGRKLEIQTAGQNWALSPLQAESSSALRSSCRDRSSTSTRSSRARTFASEGYR